MGGIHRGVGATLCCDAPVCGCKSGVWVQVSTAFCGLFLILCGGDSRFALKEFGESRCAREVQAVGNFKQHQLVGLQKQFGFLDKGAVHPLHYALVARLFDDG